MSDDAKPLTPTQRLHEVTMAAMQRRAAEPESSTEITRNAKGDVQITVTVRGIDAGQTAAEASRLYDGLAALYPRAQEAAGNGG